MAANTAAGTNCTIILINYNGYADTVECVDSILLTNTNAKIIILDNNSHSQQGQALQQKYQHHKNITCLLSTQNLGFAGGNNYACKFVQTPYVVFLNNDTVVTPQWLENLLHPFQNHSDLAFVQPKILSYHERTYFEYAGASGGMLDQLGYPYARGRIGFSLEQDLGQYNNPIEVIWASGTCLATHTQTFRDLGGFEERFFFYHEETDLCLRAINAGYRNLCHPSSIIYHKGAQSSQGLKFKKIMLVHRNNLFLITRNFPISAQFRVLPIRILLDYLSCLYYFAKSQFLYIPAVLYAHFSYLQNLPWLLRTRSRSSLAYQKLRPFSIMWQSFILKKERYSEVFPSKTTNVPTIKYEKILPENHIHRAQSKFLNLLLRPQVLLPLLVLVLTFNWFRSAQLIAAGEEALVFHAPSRLLNLYNSPWYEVGTGYAMPVILPRITLLFLASVLDIIFPNWLVQALIFASLLLAGLFGMYLFVRSLTHNRSTALLAAIFYLFNTYTMSQIWGRMLYTSIVFWAALPLWLYFWSQWLLYSRKKYFFLFLLTLTLFSFAFGHPSGVLLLALGLGVQTIYLFFTAPSHKLLLRVLLILVASIACSLWWILPYLRIGQTSFTTLAVSQQSLDSLRGVSTYFTTWDILRLNQQYLMSSQWHKGWFQSPLAQFLLNISPVVVLLGFVVNRTKTWSKYMLIFFLAMLFLSKGTNPPYGLEFYTYLFSTFPSAQVLRNSYEKIGLLYLIPYSIFFAAGLAAIHRIFPSTFLQRSVVALTTGIFFAILPWPIWWGSLFGAQILNTRVTVPSGYSELNQHLQSSPYSGRILLLPFNPGDGVQLLWPEGHYTGWDPSEMLFDRPTIAKNLREPYFDGKYLQLRHSFGTTLFPNALSEMQISYLLVRKDTLRLGTRNHVTIQKLLSTYPQLQFVFENDIGILYFNQDPSAQALFVDQSGSSIQYQKITPTRYLLQPDFRKVTNITMKSTYHSNWKLKLRDQVLPSTPAYGYANYWSLTHTPTTPEINDTIRIEFNI